MGHNIMHEVYPENVDRNKVQRDWDNYVAHADRGEGCGGLSKKIRWLEGHVCDSYEDAENYIRQKDDGWYDQLAVRFLVPREDTAKIRDLKERVAAAYKKATDIRRDVHYSHCESSYIACRYCGSRLATKYIKSNICPLCGKDLRPTSAILRQERAELKAQELQKKLDDGIKKESKKNGDIKWLVKIEYHT